MPKYIQISWKFVLSVFVAVCYLGLLVSYFKVHTNEEYVVEDDLLTMMILTTKPTPRKSKTKKPSYKLTQSIISNSTKLTTSNSFNKLVDRSNRFTKSPLKNISEKKIQTSAKIVIIAAYMRTGSTLMGGMFHHYPGTFYLFEPIRNLVNAMMDARNTTELMYVSGKRRNLTDDDKPENIVLQDIHKWLTCNFQELDIDSLVDIHHFRFKDSMFDFYHCAITHVETIRRFRKTVKNRMAWNTTEALIRRNLLAMNECLSEAKQKCLDAPLRVIKFIRLRMPLIAELLPLYPNMKVVYLQRDPRGILRSRMEAGLIKDSQFTSDVVKHCNNSLNDLVTSKILADQYAGRIKSVIYEDVAERPIEIFESVFRFCGLNFTNYMRNYTISLTSLGGSDSGRYDIERGNSSETAYQWRKEMTLSHVTLIDKHCSVVYKILGYQTFVRLTDLRNLAKPSRANTKFIL